MKPKNLITIQIIRPNFEQLNEHEKKLLVDQMAQDIAQRIVTQEEIRIKSEEIAYWQQIFLQWQVEDYHSELKYEEYRRTNQAPE